MDKADKIEVLPEFAREVDPMIDPEDVDAPDET